MSLVAFSSEEYSDPIERSEEKIAFDEVPEYSRVLILLAKVLRVIPSVSEEEEEEEVPSSEEGREVVETSIVLEIIFVKVVLEVGGFEDVGGISLEV